MKKGIFAIGTILCFSLAVFARPQAIINPSHTSSPRWAAVQWLQLLDSGDYAACWDVAAPSLQSRINKARWIEGIKKMRLEWGKVLFRKFQFERQFGKSQGFYWDEKATVRFTVRLGIAGPATETVTMVWDNEAGWRASGYDVRPKQFGRFLPLR